MIVTPGGATGPGQAVKLALSVADPSFAAARIIWEAAGQEPSFGTQNYTFSPGSTAGSYWVEAEVQWPDGRRAFATNSVIVSSNAAPVLSEPQGLPDGGFSFTLSGLPLSSYVIQGSADLKLWRPLSTNTLPASGMAVISDPQSASAGQRYYRAVQGP